MYVASPMKSTIGRMTSAKSVNASPNPDAPATKPNATMAPDSVERNMPARLNDSFHASARDARRLQCSVDSICNRIDGDTSPVEMDSPARGPGAGSAPMPVPAGIRSKVILTDLAPRVRAEVVVYRRGAPYFRPRRALAAPAVLRSQRRARRGDLRSLGDADEQRVPTEHHQEPRGSLRL